MEHSYSQEGFLCLPAQTQGGDTRRSVLVQRKPDGTVKRHQIQQHSVYFFVWGATRGALPESSGVICCGSCCRCSFAQCHWEHLTTVPGVDELCWHLQLCLWSLSREQRADGLPSNSGVQQMVKAVSASISINTQVRQCVSANATEKNVAVSNLKWTKCCVDHTNRMYKVYSITRWVAS